VVSDKENCTIVRRVQVLSSSLSASSVMSVFSSDPVGRDLDRWRKS